MFYKDKYIKYKKKYLALKNTDINNQTSGGKKCSIDDTDTILFGDGSSTAIVVITKNKKVYKIFTEYIFTPDIELDEKIKKKNIRVNNEIKIYELLTKNIVDKNISNHIVKYIGSNNCDNAKLLFKKCPKSYVEFIKLSDVQKTKMCNNFYKGYPRRKLNDKYRVVEIEYCNYSCADFIRDVSNLPEIEMEKYLDIFFFKIIHTILSIQKIFPYFTHNDLFMRNILGLREKDNGNYYTYNFNKKNYYIPQKKFFPKINDFGLTNLNDEYKNVKLYKSEYKDVYNIIFDVYNGGNLGSRSLSELCKDHPNKLKFLKLYFSNYFNVDIVDEYKTKSTTQMNWDWSNILDDEFLKSIEMKNPVDLLNGYFYNIFGKINENISR
ncbi:divergent protein kinase [Hokovirus HKV1]|uniref:Divergent protein kinase n=1 Tax=Hokovirus HKV1 TaxID=1977638 RepID=A0A1V0SGC0_9VIRU|nr:divergent protein kinase [Hokovirus HKV1]